MNLIDQRSMLQEQYDLKPMILWEDLTLNDKMKLFSYWQMLSIVQSLLSMFGSLANMLTMYNMYEQNDSGNAFASGGTDTEELLIGLGCMLTWIGLIRYMETSGDHYSILGKTLSLSMPTVLKTLISVLPVLMGYTFLGIALFWRSNRFQNAAGCLITLYALMSGDMVYDTFQDLTGVHYLLSQLYLYSFVFFSICVIQSLFISVIQDGYVTAQQTTRTDLFLGRADNPEVSPEHPPENKKILKQQKSSRALQQIIEETGLQSPTKSSFFRMEEQKGHIDKIKGGIEECVKEISERIEKIELLNAEVMWFLGIGDHGVQRERQRNETEAKVR